MKIKKCLLVIIIVALFIVLYFIFNENKDDVIRIAYTNDLSGFIFKDIASNKNNELNLKEYNFMDLGDCCGSSAQFAFATSQIDMAILCPDAIKYLNEVGNDNYVLLGNITYDSEILISDKEKENIKVVGYMNRRDKQKDILSEYFGDSVMLIPMSPLTLGYALKSNAIDAAYVDMSTYLQLDYDGITLTNDNVTQTIVVNKKVKRNANIKKIVELYNEKVLELKDEKNISSFLSDYLKLSDKEAVLEKWKKQKTRFGMLKLED